MLAVLVCAFLLARVLFWLPVFQPWHLRATDVLIQARNRVDSLRPEYDSTVVFVEIGDETAANLGASYVERAAYAQVIRNLSGAKVRLQVHDTLFKAQLDPSQDRELVEATRDAKEIVFGFVAGASRSSGSPPSAWKVQVRGDVRHLPHSTASLANFSPLGEAARYQGFINVTPDMDGVFRRTPLVMRGDDGVYASLPLAAACVHLGVEPSRIVVEPGRAIRLGDKAEIPIDRAGNVRVNFVGPWGTMAHYSFEKVFFAGEDKLDLELLRSRLEGRIVLLADLTTDAGDVGPSPFDENYPLSGLHANVIHSIVSGQFIRDLGWLGNLAIELLLVSGFYWLLRIRSTALLALFAFAGVLLLLLGVFLLFVFGDVIAHMARPLTTTVLALVCGLAYRQFVGARDRAILQSAFEAYFPPRLVRNCLREPDRVTAGGRRAVLTILFSDIKGFTSRSSSMDPSDVQEMLNEYFELMVDIVFEHGGTLDKFIGDGLMVFYGDPEEQTDHADRAVKTAIRMQQRLEERNAQKSGLDEEPMLIRIGINTGEVLVGNMGSDRRLSYTVLGAAVNLAARLEPAAPPGGVLISQATRDALHGNFSLEAAEPIHAKGFADPIPVFKVDCSP